MAAFFERGFEVWCLRFPDPEPHIQAREDWLDDRSYQAYIAELRKKVQILGLSSSFVLSDAHISGSKISCIGMPSNSRRKRRMFQCRRGRLGWRR